MPIDPIMILIIFCGNLECSRNKVIPRIAGTMRDRLLYMGYVRDTSVLDKTIRNITQEPTANNDCRINKILLLRNNSIPFLTFPFGVAKIKEMMKQLTKTYVHDEKSFSMILSSTAAMALMIAIIRTKIIPELILNFSFSYRSTIVLVSVNTKPI